MDVATPFAKTGPLPEMVPMAAAPATKTTVPPETATGLAIERVFVSALVELKVHVERPETFVNPQMPYPFVAPVLVAVKVGMTPKMGLELASKRVMVTVDVDVPLAVTGPEPAIVEVDVLAAPG